jgi:hypothetical protein
MSVLADAISVVIPCRALEVKFRGGEAAYRELFPRDCYCTDGQVARVKFYCVEAMFPFVERLAFWGLNAEADWAPADIALIDGEGGIRNECDWLAFAMHEGGFPIAWMRGEEPVPLAAPDGWEPSDSLELMRIAEEECAERLMLLAAEDGVKVYLDLATGLEFPVRQTAPEDGMDDWR